MAFSISLISRIQTASGGKRLPLALVGDAGAQIDNSALPSQPFRMMTASFDGPELVECNQYHKFLSDYLGADAVLRLVKGAENDNIAKQPEVEAMPVYPAAGSVKVLFGAVVKGKSASEAQGFWAFLRSPEAEPFMKEFGFVPAR